MSKSFCAFVHFGTALARRLEIGKLLFYKKFTEKMENECGSKAHKTLKKNDYYNETYITDDNTPSWGCKGLEMELFGEPLWNYARVIGIDSNECIVMRIISVILMTSEGGNWKRFWPLLKF
ncbi:hypothetical protein niasHT_010936 [Heterodera trifolii]|uniref:Uncharacterized protein n=1 Tax=Heterodera trifolii TaxID=157864 RepID=A0ABD2LFX8_9BILA